MEINGLKSSTEETEAFPTFEEPSTPSVAPPSHVTPITNNRRTRSNAVLPRLPSATSEVNSSTSSQPASSTAPLSSRGRRPRRDTFNRDERPWESPFDRDQQLAATVRAINNENARVRAQEARDREQARAAAAAAYESEDDDTPTATPRPSTSPLHRARSTAEDTTTVRRQETRTLVDAATTRLEAFNDSINSISDSEASQLVENNTTIAQDSTVSTQDTEAALSSDASPVDTSSTSTGTSHRSTLTNGTEALTNGIEVLTNGIEVLTNGTEENQTSLAGRPSIGTAESPHNYRYHRPGFARFPTWGDLQENRPSPRVASAPIYLASPQTQRSTRYSSAPDVQPHVRFVQIVDEHTDTFHNVQATRNGYSNLLRLLQRILPVFTKMNPYPSYLDSPGGVPNPRQAPPSPSQHQNGMNGGGMGMAGSMVGFPTPAGHQSDLNFIMQLVEELSGQLQHNQGLTAGIVDKMGKVRAKAQGQELSNDELLSLAAAELNTSSKNIEKENSELRKALEKVILEKKENFKLAIHGGNILADILDKMHKFKATHEADTLAWHKNYRKQLAHEREENLDLRNQINDMKASAARANGHLRDMRRAYADDDELNELKIRYHQLRLERRTWKRMALPLLHQSDSEFSDDDDIVDPEEKKRLASEKAEKERKEREGEGEGAP